MARVLFGLHAGVRVVLPEGSTFTRFGSRTNANWGPRKREKRSLSIGWNALLTTSEGFMRRVKWCE